MEAAFFDLDKTVIAKASLLAYGPTLRREGFISRRLVIRAGIGQLVFRVLGADDRRMAKVREASLRVARGWDQQRLRALVVDTMHEVIEPIVYDEALALVEHHRSAGRRVYLVSSSPAEIVDPLAYHLGADGAIATQAEIDARGRYTGEVAFYAYGPAKADALRDLAAREGLDLAASFAYSDSITDVPMLEAVGHPIAVNPDRELRRVASARGWEIRTFAHPVPLQSRLPWPRGSRQLRFTLAGATIVSLACGAAMARALVHRRRARLSGLRPNGPSSPQPRATHQRSRATESSSWEEV